MIGSYLIMIRLDEVNPPSANPASPDHMIVQFSIPVVSDPGANSK